MFVGLSKKIALASVAKVAEEATIIVTPVREFAQFILGLLRCCGCRGRGRCCLGCRCSCQLLVILLLLLWIT